MTSGAPWSLRRRREMRSATKRRVVGRHRSRPSPAKDHGRQRDRALLSSAGGTVASRAVTALASLITVGLAARTLTGSELGVVSVLTILATYFGFGDFGLGSMLMTRLPAAHAREDFSEMRALVSSVLCALTLVASSIAAIGITSIFLLPWQSLLGAQSIPWPQVRASLLVFFCFGAVGIPAAVGMRVLSAMQRGALIRVWNSSFAVTMVVAVAICSALNAPMWTYVMAITAPSALLGVIQFGQLVCVLYPYLRPDRTALNLVEGAHGLWAGAQYAVLSLGWVIAYTLDAIVVSDLLGAAKAAVFGIAARLFSLVGGTLTNAGQQMWPAISEALARGDVAWVRRRFRHSILLSAATVTAGCVAITLFGRSFARAWVGPALVPPLSLLLIMAVWTIYMTVITQYSYLLLAHERIKVLALLGLLIAVVNLLSSIWFTKRFGLAGPIVGNLFAAVLVQLWPTRRMSRQLARDIGLIETTERGGRRYVRGLSHAGDASVS